MTYCPKCLRPINEGNSPNAAEGHETDGEICEAYAEVHELQKELDRIKNGIKTCEGTMIVDGNDMFDWGWSTHSTHHIKHRYKDEESS